MRVKWLRVCPVAFFAALFVLDGPAEEMQSLMDAARMEAQRREKVEQLGIVETVIEGNGACYTGEGNVTLFDSPQIDREKPKVAASSKDRSSLRRFRSQLKKLDRNIQQEEGRIDKLQDRLLELKRKNLRIQDISKIADNEELQERTRLQIEELKNKLKLLKKEKSEVYDSGRREGFLPGELQGRGIVP